MMRKQKLLEYIHKVRTLVEGREGFIKKIRLYLWIIIDIISLIIDGQWVSCQNIRMETYDTRLKRTCVPFLFCVKRVAQLPLQELNFISQFNFNLALPNIVANKTLGESALTGNFFSNHMYLSHLSLLIALVN